MPVGGAAIKATEFAFAGRNLKVLSGSDAVLLGAVGAPEFDHLNARKALRNRTFEASKIARRICQSASGDLLTTRSLIRSPLRTEIFEGTDIVDRPRTSRRTLFRRTARFDRR